VMPLGCSITIQSLNWISHTVPDFGQPQFSIDRQFKSPILTFAGVRRLPSNEDTNSAIQGRVEYFKN